MKKVERQLFSAYRVIDANLNRSKEGLRVCEEIARFYLKDKTLTARFGRLRHRLAAITKGPKIDQRLLLNARDSKNDPGKKFFLGPKRRSFKNIFMANTQRAKEALRVLEEFLKLIDNNASRKLQKIRFDLYELEKESIERFPSLLDTR